MHTWSFILRENIEFLVLYIPLQRERRLIDQFQTNALSVEFPLSTLHSLRTLDMISYVIL